MSKTFSSIISQDEQNFERKIFYILCLTYVLGDNEPSHCEKCLSQKSSMKSHKLIHIKERFGDIMSQDKQNIWYLLIYNF